MRSSAAEAQLARWGIDDTTAEQAGLFDVDDVRQVYPTMRAGPAIIIPYYDATGQLVRIPHTGQPFARVRRIDPPPPPGFVKRKQVRYTQPSHVGPQVYFAPFMDWQAMLGDPSVPLIITEGEAKAIAACAAGFQTLSLGGVYNFTTPGGQLLPSLDAIHWDQRHTYICFDSDAISNPNVVAAEARLIDELQARRGAKCHIVRLPEDGEEKVGIDDYLRVKGPDELERLIQMAPALTGVDARVIAFNKRYAWVSQEGQIYDLETKLLIKKDNFTSGDGSSSEKITVPSGGKGGTKEIQIAAKWLTHQHAQRYAEILFRPGEGQTVMGEKGRSLNLWTGWDAHEPGDVEPWLALNEFLFSGLPDEHQSLALKLVAYKAQHPEEKIPLAIVLIGLQGSGKTLWADCVREAFAPYGTSPNPGSLASEFQGWLERSLIATIHEMTPKQMEQNFERIKALISDLRRPMNEKYRPARDINSYTFYIFTSNHQGVGSFASDDRRMFVVNTPKPATKALYDRCWEWRKAGGPRHLLDYLLNYDLQGWTPPQRAPLTAEKYLAMQEGMSPVQRLAEDMKNATHNVIIQWLDAAATWAQQMELSPNVQAASRARDVAQHIRGFQVRPFYTPEELALMFPAIIENLMGSKFIRSTPAGEISRQLRDCGIQFLVNLDDVRGFTVAGQLRQYLVISDPEHFGRPLTQAQFTAMMKEWPTYGQLKGKLK